jgi:hypothetical protein
MSSMRAVIPLACFLVTRRRSIFAIAWWCACSTACLQRWLPVLVVAFVSGGGGFLQPAFAAPAFRFLTWQVEKGLPQNKVTAVAQTQDAYL